MNDSLTSRTEPVLLSKGIESTAASSRGPPSSNASVCVHLLTPRSVAETCCSSLHLQPRQHSSCQRQHLHALISDYAQQARQGLEAIPFTPACFSSVSIELPSSAASLLDLLDNAPASAPKTLRFRPACRDGVNGATCKLLCERRNIHLRLPWCSAHGSPQAPQPDLTGLLAGPASCLQHWRMSCLRLVFPAGNEVVLRV